ncbi:FMN reductase [Pseudonocardia sp. TRM90224]|uniref:FMN reductase n=1 Tax=Pseudonocardia sp. TRM90224 TaxID=2812678 RepID=UPI001E62A69B|nr:FMN reductase [Pseudonocardia sp. TRM90224]
MSRLVVLSAGMRQPSSTRLLADRLAAATTAATGAELEVRTIELRELGHDIVNATVTGFAAPALQEVLDAVAAADGLVAVSPTMNGSYSGLFKSFFDVLGDDALVDVPVLIGATGGTARHSLVLEHALRPLFSYLRAVVVPTGVYAATQDWGAESGLAARIERAGRELAAQIAARPPRVVLDPLDEPTPFEQLLG